MDRRARRWKMHANALAKCLIAAGLAFVGYQWMAASVWPTFAKVATLALLAPIAYWFVIRDAHFFVVSQPCALANPEATVIIALQLKTGEYGDEAARSEIQEATDGLARKLEESGGGYYDGDEYGGGVCRLFIRGSDGDALFQIIEGDIRRERVFIGASVELYQPNARIAHRTITI